MTFGAGELILILLLVLFFFGAKRIPVIGRGLGEGIRNFKMALGKGDKTPDDRTLDDPPENDRS